MRTHLTLFTASLLSFAARTQPVLNLATNAPAVGTSYTLNYGPHVLPGVSGANQNWDLRALSTDSSLTVQYVPVASTPNGVQFPNATVAELSDMVAQYYRVATDGIHFAGSDDGESVIVHTPQGKYLPFPCTFGSTWSSPQNATFFHEDTEVVRTGIFTGVADGHGTLTMPNGTIPNVLRVHWTHTLQDDMGFLTINYLYDGYAYFRVGQAHPIAELVTATINLGSGPITEQFSRWTGDLTTGLDSGEITTVQLFPNPATEETHIVWPEGLGARASVFALDMAGRRALIGRYNVTPGTTTSIDVRMLHAGMYQLLIVGDTEKQLELPIVVR